MELVGLAVLLVAAAAAIGLFLVLRRRRAQRRRLMGAEMAALDERISERLAELVGKGRRRPEPVAMTATRSVTTSEPDLVAVTEPEPVAVIEPQPVAVAVPETIAEQPSLPAPSPVTGPQKPGPIQIGRARQQAVPGAGRTRRRLRPGYVIAGLLVIALLVVVGGQLVGRFPSSGAATPSPTEISGVVPTGTGDLLPTPGPTTSETVAVTPRPTATLGGPSPTPLPTPFVYIVRRGDTLSNIAEAFGVSLADLIAANPQIEDPSLIYAGNVITLPPGATATASAVP